MHDIVSTLDRLMQWCIRVHRLQLCRSKMRALPALVGNVPLLYVDRHTYYNRLPPIKWAYCIMHSICFGHAHTCIPYSRLSALLSVCEEGEWGKGMSTMNLKDCILIIWLSHWRVLQFVGCSMICIIPWFRGRCVLIGCLAFPWINQCRQPDSGGFTHSARSSSVMLLATVHVLSRPLKFSSIQGPQDVYN